MQILLLTQKDREDIFKTYMLRMSKVDYLVLDGNNGLLRVESGQDVILRELLYDRGGEKVEPYGITVEEFTNQISKLNNKLGRHGIKDEGLNMKSKVGVEGRIRENVLAGDKYSMAYDRTPKKILRIVYGSGKKNKSGGFYPKRAEGRIAKSYLRHEH
ncbi:Desiccation-related protein PCC13-62 [Capsicum annuum]|uniref:Desiccation-related protein PCC13-62 n=1 Tax=Capsicum annuum TaxID=4072 RepID=A0A2G2YJN7_CAPAN|nr:Desiccation-related protein PCC13-62 [Capsicum annuum]PHT69953.1 Desiccation-related protein PCC13-62 [Capsicum annuum]